MGRSDLFGTSFFEDFDKRAKKTVRRTLGVGILLAVGSTVLSVASLVGVVWGIILVLQHTGII